MNKLSESFSFVGRWTYRDTPAEGVSFSPCRATDRPVARSPGTLIAQSQPLLVARGLQSALTARRAHERTAMRNWIVGAALFAAWIAPATAAPITTFPDSVVSWNVGSGQTNGNFVVTRDATFPGGSLELGLRIQERTLGANYIPVSAGGLANAMYVVPTGASPPTNPGDFARWNFDFSISYAGGLSNLSSISLQIEELTPGITPLSDVPFPALGGTLFQDSWNPGFDFLSGPGLAYDFNAPGIYRITLSATGSGQTVSDSILVNIGDVALQPVPEPMSLAAFGLISLTVFGFRARRSR